MSRVVLGSDHAGYALKRQLASVLEAEGLEVEDVGTHDTSSVDYPDFGAAAARKVAAGEADWGLLVCGSGIGISIAANKVAGIRAAVCRTGYEARMARRHNDANMLCLGERITGAGLAEHIVAAWLGAEFEGGRHQKRIDKITALEKEQP